MVGSRSLLDRLDDRSVDQAMNVASLPGVLDPVLALPDVHQGYGFPIGGVAAFDLRSGVVSPGGVGYDINCGVRLLRSPLKAGQVKTALRPLVDALFKTIPTGVGCRRQDLTVKDSDMEELLQTGARWAVKAGFGRSEDLENCESRGTFPGADPQAVSLRARERGQNQLGTLGSGNHFVEVQRVDQILDSEAASAFGLERDQVLVTIHTGSRGLGYQVCAESLESAMEAAARAGIRLPGKDLAAAPLGSPEARAYLGAMASAANFAFANRQILTHWVRRAFEQHWPEGRLDVVYDVCHNIAREETLESPRGQRRVLVHRKGATRALPPGHPELPVAYRPVGQPVLVPGDMGRASYVMAGNPDSFRLSFASACHGAGRELSRSQAKKRYSVDQVKGQLSQAGVYVRATGKHTLVEEMPEAYKEVSEVTLSTQRAGIARQVARLVPMGVIKG